MIRGDRWSLILLTAGLTMGRGAWAEPESAAVLYEAKCGRCHVAYEPAAYAAEEWRGVVQGMKSKAALTVAEMVRLVEYLERESGEGDRMRTEGPAVGGYLYTEYFRTQEKAANFDLHYLAVSVSGRIDERIDYAGEFELEHGGKGDNTFVEQAYIDYWFRPNAGVKIGAILTPFNRFDEYHDPLNNYLITRPQVAREIGVSAWKDVGIDLHGYARAGDQGAVGVDLYAINGLGAGGDLRGSRQYRDNNEELAFGGRVNYVFRDMLEVGGSVYRGTWDDSGELDLTMLGGHFMLRTGVANLYGEWAQARSQNPEPLEEGEMSGFFVQASRLFDRRYRPSVRWGRLDYLDEGDLLGRDPGKGNEESSELALAFACYPNARTVFKVEYSFFAEGDRVVERDDDQLGLQAAVRF